MSQPIHHSAAECVANTAAGFAISWAVWECVVGPLYGIDRRASDDLGIVAIFTVASLVRGFVLRRAFEWIARAK